jgi:hypothetical protein
MERYWYIDEWGPQGEKWPRYFQVTTWHPKDAPPGWFAEGHPSPVRVAAGGTIDPVWGPSYLPLTPENVAAARAAAEADGIATGLELRQPPSGT